MSELLNGIFECLDINSGTGLATEDNLQSMTSFQRLFYTQVHEKIGIDAVYFLRDANGIAKVPLIYFSVIQKYDAKQVAELHRLSWNLGEAPLLFVVTPDEILIYNNYETPQVIENGNLDPTAGIIETLSLTDGLVSQQLALKKYHRSLLESGEYWRESMTRFNAQNRVDATLISNLRIMRRTLINQISKRCDKSKEIITGVVHALLSRSIFIKYLEERKDSNGETVFPQDFYCNFMESAKRYTDVLNSKEATYNLFRILKDKFNGDTLQVSEIETEIITQDDLDELRTFILGDSELESRQLTLWPIYSFDIIPIQLISSIYELFFHLSDEEDEKGTYYTPLHLVNLVMDEVYPWEGKYKDISFFDPSCGSGIFLVEAYRRLVCRWMSQNAVQAITCDQLNLLLKNSIFGVDINEEAIRVASFSLSLVDFHDFECIVKNAREIFVAPHLIIKQSHKNGTFLSEVLDYDAVFNHSLLGIHGEIEQLKYLSVIIGSRVFSYYHILTNRKWLVERDELEAGDIWQTPIPKPNNAELTEACNIFDKLVNSPKENYLLEQFARNMYRLKEYECYQIDDVIDYVYDYFKNKNRSVSFSRPSIDNYKLYYTSLKVILTRTFGTGMGFSGDLYFGDAPLSVLVLNVEHSTTKDLNVIIDNEQLNEILLNLDRSLVDNQQTVFVRRNLRIYQSEKIFIVKPAQRKYWTYSAACRDADEIFEDISKAWR